MKFLGASAVIAALFATAALADSNEIYVNQLGNGNLVGDEANPVEQSGTYNEMSLTQAGNGNAIGSRALKESPAPTWPGATQTGFSQNMVVTQPGNSNSADNLLQNGGDNNDMFVKQSGNENRIAVFHQAGNQNDGDIVQSGNRNFAHDVTQIGDKNVLDLVQSGNDNYFYAWQGDYATTSCTQCVIEARQSGNGNVSDLRQQDSKQFAQIHQSGNNNSAYTRQHR